MKKKDSILQEINATVMPQTIEGLQKMMKNTGLTMGEVIDRLTVQIAPREFEHALYLAEEKTVICFSNLPEEQMAHAYLEMIRRYAQALCLDFQTGLEQGPATQKTETPMAKPKKKILTIPKTEK